MLKYYIIFHLVCGLIAAGMVCANLQARFPKLAVKDYREDLGFSLFFGLPLGPIAAIVALFLTGFAEHGCSLRECSKHTT